MRGAPARRLPQPDPQPDPGAEGGPDDPADDVVHGVGVVDLPAQPEGRVAAELEHFPDHLGAHAEEHHRAEVLGRAVHHAVVDRVVEQRGRRRRQQHVRGAVQRGLRGEQSQRDLPEEDRQSERQQVEMKRRAQQSAPVSPVVHQAAGRERRGAAAGPAAAGRSGIGTSSVMATHLVSTVPGVLTRWRYLAATTVCARACAEQSRLTIERALPPAGSGPPPRWGESPTACRVTSRVRPRVARPRGRAPRPPRTRSPQRRR